MLRALLCLDREWAKLMFSVPLSILFHQCFLGNNFFVCGSGVTDVFQVTLCCFSYDLYVIDKRILFTQWQSQSFQYQISRSRCNLDITKHPFMGPHSRNRLTCLKKFVLFLCAANTINIRRLMAARYPEPRNLWWLRTFKSSLSTRIVNPQWLWKIEGACECSTDSSG